jgi:outer membrane protein OmpA-like peptidoglycan-associated protein
VYRESIEELIVMVDENPGMVIEVASHTDSRGNYEYNQTLSQHRV